MEVTMNDSTTAVESTTVVEKQEFDYGLYKQYATWALRDNDTVKIFTVVMPNVLYAKLRDHLQGFGFKRHPRQRYFFAPATPETEAVALLMVETIGSVQHPEPAPEGTAEPATATATAEGATATATKPAAKRKVTPAPKPSAAKPKRATKAAPKPSVDDAWVDDIPLA